MKTSVLPLFSAPAITDAGTLLIALWAVRNPVGTVAARTPDSGADGRGAGVRTITMPGSPTAPYPVEAPAARARHSPEANLGTRLAATATSDAQIVGLLHQSNASEIAAGQLAQQRAQDAAVKSFAQQMVSEHTALDTRGNALATQAGMPTPSNAAPAPYQPGSRMRH